MTDLEALERQVTALSEKEAIRELKYRYIKCIDRNDMEGLRDVFVEDATSAFVDGRDSFQGRDAIIAFLGQRKRLSVHAARHPEITLTSPTTATGAWSMEDTFFNDDGTVLHGAGIYHDEYVKVDGAWKIRTTGYNRVFEHVERVNGSLVKGPKAWAVPGSFAAERPRASKP